MLNRLAALPLVVLVVGCGMQDASSAADASEPVPPAPELRVLFVGNSLTSANNLPGVTSQIAQAKDRTIETAMYAPGGRQLRQHAQDARLLSQLEEGHWDVVVLQEQSQYPGFDQEHLEEELYPAVKRLCDAIRARNPDVRIVFYMAMAHQNGDHDARNVEEISELGTYEGMQRRVNATYTELARHNNAEVAPVGVAWQRVRAERPVIHLYTDVVHPNAIGTYLAACVMYATIFDDSPEGTQSPNAPNPVMFAYLQRVAWETVSAPQPTAMAP